MTARMIRTLVLGAGAAALVVGAAAPAMAATIDVTTLPANVKMNVGDTVNIALPWTDGYACGAQGVQWTAAVPGRQDAVVLSTNNPCTMTGLAVSVTDNAKSNKKNAVVKLVGTNGTGAKSVMTVVIHVNGQPGHPGKGNKPAS